MPGSPNINQKSTKPNPGITIKKEPSSPPKRDVKSSLDALRIGSNRLPSFRGPRDLTLSSLASSSSSSSPLQPQSRPKRTFVPNIPVRREKGEKVIESRSEKTPKRIPNIVKQERGRGKGRGREREFIQTKGSLFGEGIAVIPSIKRSSEYGGYGGSKEGGAGGSKAGEMRMPVLNPNAAASVDKEYEESYLKEIKGENQLDSDDEMLPEKDAPRSLPLVKSDEAKKSIKNDDLKMEDILKDFSLTEGKNEIKIKEEPGLEMEVQNDENQCNVSQEKLKNFPKNSAAYSLLTKKENEFIQLQFPPCLPAFPPDEAQQGQSSSGTSGNEGRSDQESHVDNGLFIKSSKPRCTLDTLPEGKIGELLVYESGKVALCLGDHIFEVKQGIPVRCLQDVVKIDVDPEKKTGNMTVLGHLHDRLLAMPDLIKMVETIDKS